MRGVRLRTVLGSEIDRREEVFFSLTTSPRSDMKFFLRNRETRTPYFVTVAENLEGTILGWGTCYALGGRRLIDVFVREDCRGKGLGRALVGDVLRENSCAGYGIPIASTSFHPSFWAYFHGKVLPSEI